MGAWGEFEFFAPYEGEPITEVNGVALPLSYIQFMIEHNGGEGDIGETWFVLFGLDELLELNEDYEVEKYLPGCVIIGSNGGEEFYGIDKDGNYFNVPSIMDIEDVCILGNDIEKLPEAVNAIWK